MTDWTFSYSLSTYLRKNNGGEYENEIPNCYKQYVLGCWKCPISHSLNRKEIILRRKKIVM